MARLPILLVACPPWRTECANLALAYLSAALRANGIDTWVGDFNILLHNRIEEPLRKYWELTSSTFWARPEVFKGSFSDETKTFVSGFVDELIERDGDMIGFSTQSANCMFTLELVRMLRERGCAKTIVLGGPSVRLQTPGDPRTVGLTGFKPEGLDESSAVRELRPFLDLVDVFVEGEGELTLLELARRHRDGAGLEGTAGAVVWNRGRPESYVPRPPVSDLDVLPSPTFEEFDLGAYGKRMLPFLTSRGCVRKCAMCYERILWPGFRHRGISAILAEMRSHIERWGINQFSCNDLLLNGNLIFLGQLCDAIAQAGLDLTWWGNAVVHRLMDRPLFERLKAGRVGALVYGIESGSQKILRKMRKGYIVEDADQVLRLGADAGIKNVINLMVGFPGESEEDHRATLDFVKRNRDCIHHVGVLAMTMIYPHSPLSEQWEYYGVDPKSLEQFNPYSVNVDWRDMSGMDAATRQERFWEIFRLLRGAGIGVTGVEDEEELTGEVVEELLVKLESPTAWVREDAIVRLARVRDAALADRMAAALGDASFLVAGQALLNLSRLAPDRAWREAEPLIRRGVSYVEYAAALALASRRDGRTMDLLEDRLSREKFERHSSEMQHALAWHREVFARLEAFQAAVDDGDGAAVESLLAHPVEWVIGRGIAWLREHRPEALAPQASGLALAARHESASVRLEAWKALADSKAPVEASTLLRGRTDDCARVRAEAEVLALTRGEPDALPPAQRWPEERFHPPTPDGARHSLEFLRLYAVRAAARLPRPPARTLFICRALVEGSDDVRRTAFETLEVWKDWRYVEEALDAFRSQDPTLRRLAIRYFGSAADPSYEERVLPMLHDRDLFAAQEATASLARLRSAYLARYVPDLLEEKALPDLPDFVREPIERCIRSREAVLATVRASPTAELLVDTWKQCDALDRVFLLELLATPQAAAAQPALELGLTDSHPEVRLQTLKVIELLSEPDLTASVRKLLEDPSHDCRAWACRYLTRRACAAARPSFLTLLHDPDPYVREWAARGLGRIANPVDVQVLADLLQDATYSSLPAELRADLEPLYQAARQGARGQQTPAMAPSS
ncbi:MAG: HEAT repeat domain-containing protein [Candidatus Wallbacteria bacterium]|nr:HEAT repeat domain-containing protein [Candidatus Wallbacteria bacterium]